MAGHTKVRIDLFISDDVIEFLKEEAERRNAEGGEQWTWRQLAWVRSSIMLEEWAKEHRQWRAKEAQSVKCNCGADRIGPSAEAHDHDCPAGIRN